MKQSLYEYSLPELKTGIVKSRECIAHIHVHFELLYIRKGIIPVMIGGTIYTLSPGDCAVILPGTVHNHMNGEENNKMFLTVCAPHFAGQYEETIRANFAETPIIRKENMHKNVVCLLEMLIELLLGSSIFEEQKAQIATASFQLFFAYTLPLLHLKQKGKNNPLETTQRIMEYLSQNSKRQLSLDIIANELGINKYQISRIFTNQLHTNFNQYLNYLRVDTAKKLLTTTTKSITTICFESGFSAVRTFNTAFYNITGKSPKEYRQAHLNGTLENKYDFYLKILPS